MAGVTSTARPRTRVRLGRALVVFGAVLVLEVLLAGAWAGWQALQARDELLAGREQAGAARAAVSALDVEAAAAALDEASASFASGHDRLSDPIVRLVGVAPVVGDDLRAARDLAGAGRLVAESASRVVDTALQAGGVEAFSPSDGRIPVDAIAALADPAQAAVVDLERARGLAERVPDEGVDGRILAARDELHGQVLRAQELVGQAARMTASLPWLLGADAPRRYLFAAENPAEQRGTGGFLGAYSVLEIDDGRLSFGEFIPIQELTSLPRDQIQPPNADYAARYNRFGGAGFWQGINATPDFPSAASAIARLWEATEGTAVDGVIAADPMAYRALLQISGPVEVPEFGTVGSDEVVEVVANEAYGELGSDDRKQVLGAIAAGALQGALTGDVEPMYAGQILLEVAEGGHLKMHVDDPDAQALLAELELDSAFPDPAGDFLAVTSNSASFTKLDYYIDRSIDYRVELHPDGSLSGSATVTFANHAPTQGLPRHVIGPGYGGRLAPAEQRSWVSVYCATGCEPTAAGDAVAERELGHGVVSDFLQVRSGESVSMTVPWQLPDGWDPDAGTYRLSYFAQPTLRPTQLDVQVVPPPGWRTTGTQQLTEPVERTTVYETTLERS